jgi:hypothetical protein
MVVKRRAHKIKSSDKEQLCTGCHNHMHATAARKHWVPAVEACHGVGALPILRVRAETRERIRNSGFGSARLPKLPKPAETAETSEPKTACGHSSKATNRLHSALLNADITYCAILTSDSRLQHINAVLTVTRKPLVQAVDRPLTLVVLYY